ncbi:MAG TPA: energy transducer TonB [Verrucomicrobiae bacterium]|nr:energy transducer TonB [Verrucomicrobiae bacterium]
MTTMIADPPRRTALGVGFNANRGRSTDAEAWKQQIGTKPIPARLALLPEQKQNWGRVGASAVLQISILVFFLLVPLLYPEGMKTALTFYNSTPLTTPVTEIPVAPPPPPPPKVKAPEPPKAEVKAPEPVEPPKLNPQQPHIFANLVKPAVVQPKKIEKPEIKDPDFKPAVQDVKINTNDNAPKRPKEDVKTGNLSSGSTVAATVKAPVEKVQTGGFGDENGITGKAVPGHAGNVNGFGNPALPGGEGYGNGTGGKNGIRGTVASTGFGNGTAVPPSGNGGKKSVVASSGFGAMDTAEAAPKKKAEASGPADTPPEITDKPNPEYTAEGRSMKVEGDVRISVVFKANGTVQVNNVVSGLGHGLDEAAVRAAQQIKFKPAKRQGEPVDFPAVIRIEFRLAY